jgi:hypothetical protein
VIDAQMSNVAGQNHQHYEHEDDEDSPHLVTHTLTFSSSTCNSTTSSLTTATAYHEVEEASTSNQKHPAKPPSSNNSPSPVKKKILSNFDVHQSGKESILSGDEIDWWEHEEDRVAHLFAEQSKKEDLMD